MLPQAADYLRRGLCVIPIIPRGKRPSVAWEIYQKRLSTETELASWFGNGTSANVGIVTGHVSGVIVLDVDGPEGAESLRGREMPPTPTTKTARGEHRYFRWPGFPVKNAVRLAPGLDIRGDGGFVVCPPSIHESGAVYQWTIGLEDVPFADVPAWLLSLLAQPTKTAPSSPQVGETIPEGTRNDVLFRLGASLRAKGLGQAAIEAALQEENRARCRPPLDAAEVESIAQSAGRYAPGQPAPAPPDWLQDAPPPDDADAPPEEDLAALDVNERATDAGNARRLVARHGRDLRYCDAMGGWLAWDGRRWATDDTLEVERRAKETVNAMFKAAVSLPGAPEEAQAKRKKALAWCFASESARGIAAMVRLAQSERPVVARAEDFDQDPWLLNCHNGILDLRTGVLRPHDRAAMITKLSPVDYDAAASHPTLARYLCDVTRGDQDLEDYLQRAVGYSLTGETTEECFFLLLGPGNSGKSTLVEGLLALAGDYGVKSSFDAFLEQRNGGGPTPELARLRGARVVGAVETSRSRQLNEPLVKELTGRDSFTARHLHCEPITFKPAFKLWLACNEAPRLTDTDTGLWRRLQRVPFEYEMPEEKRDPAVKAALVGLALPALLAWAVNGCKRWQAEGLRPAAIVRSTTAQLRADFDPLAEFFAERCVFRSDAQVPALALRHTYEAWAVDLGAKAISNREWGQRLKAKGCTQARIRREDEQISIWRGVGLGTAVQNVQDKPLFRSWIPCKSPREINLQNGLCPAHPAQEAYEEFKA